MIRVREINDPAALAEYRLAWDALLPQTRGASFFHSYAWLETYWRHYGEGAVSDAGDSGRPQRLRVLAVEHSGRPIGFLPLVVRHDPTRFGALRRLTYPLHGWGSFYGPIGPDAAATLLAGLRHVARTPRDWDVLDLPFVPREATDRGRTRRALCLAGFRPYETPYEVSPQIDCRRPWESYWGGLKSHWRTNQRRNERRLAERGQVRHLRYRPLGGLHDDDDPRWDLWRACLQLAESSWQADSTSGTTLCHPQVRDFLTDLHEVAARCGTLDVNLLYLDSRPIAYAYNYHYDGCVFGLRSGYDPEFQELGAGSVLLGRALRDSFAREDTVYDLGSGYLESKRHWRPHLQPSHRYLHYPAAAPKAQLVRLRQWLKSWRAAPAGTTA